MSHDLINFLPFDRARAFNRVYFMRLATIVTTVLALLALAHLALLYPTYQYVRNSHEKRAEELALMRATLEDLKKDEVAGRIARLSEEAARANVALERPVASALMRGVLAVPSTGVVITGVSADLDASPAKDNRVRVAGIAGSREALRGYHLALSALPNVVSADLPLSAYASETEIPFSITLSGALMP